jgi:hypothetical protein
MLGGDSTSASGNRGVASMRSNRHPLIRCWALSTCAFFFIGAAWVFALPIGSATDEQVQLVKAASVVRGEILGPSVSPALDRQISPQDRIDLAVCEQQLGKARCDRAVTVVSVPQSFADFGGDQCYIFPRAEPAGCGRGLSGSIGSSMAATYVGRYPPLYYAIVGLPSLIFKADAAVYGMRLVSALLASLFLGLAFALARVWSRSRLLPVAVAVTATPMVHIFGSLVNPSGLECTAAVCVWTGGLVLVIDRRSQPPPSLLIATVGAAVVMVLTRALSPLWLTLIVVTLVTLAPGSVATLFRSRSVQIGAGVVAVAAVAAVSYVEWAHSLSVYPVGFAVPKQTSWIGIVGLALGRSGLILRELIGAVGSDETGPPLLVVVLWVICASVIVLAGLIMSRRRHGIVLMALLVTSIAIPTALMVSQAHEDGLVWQARDGFPLYAGTLLVAGAVGGRRQIPALAGLRRNSLVHWAYRHSVSSLAIALAVVQIIDFLWALRRYTVGLGSTLNPFAHVPGGWSPPVPAVALSLVLICAAVILCTWISSIDRSRRLRQVELDRHPDPTPRGSILVS